MAATPELQPQQPPSEQVEREPLTELIDDVRRDAKRDPKGYQRETIVPEGGE